VNLIKDMMFLYYLYLIIIDYRVKIGLTTWWGFSISINPAIGKTSFIDKEK